MARTKTGALPVGKRLDRIETKLDKLMSDVAALKVKAGIWGAIGSVVAWITMHQAGCK